MNSSVFRIAFLHLRSYDIALSSGIPELKSNPTLKSTAASCKEKLTAVLLESWDSLVKSLLRRAHMLYDELASFNLQQLLNEAEHDWELLDWKSPSPTVFRLPKALLTRDVIVSLAHRFVGEQVVFKNLARRSAMVRRVVSYIYRIL